MRSASFCLGSAEASHSEVLALEESQMCSTWAQQAHDAFLGFYDHRETRIRTTAQVVFADVVDSRRAQQELIELLSWVRDRWWLRLSPDDVDERNESFMDPCSVRRRMRGERVLICLEERFGSQLVEYEWNMVRARYGEEQSAGLWRIEMANAHAHAASKQEAAVAAVGLWRQRHSTTPVLMLKIVVNDLWKASSANAIVLQSLIVLADIWSSVAGSAGSGL